MAEVAHSLAAHPDLRGIGSFIFLFAVIWWLWLMGTTYHDIHGNNDIRTRVFTFAQMFAITGMAVFAHNAIGSGSVGFAFCFGVAQAIMFILWWRLKTHDPEHTQGNTIFLITYGAVVIMIFLSAFIPTPYRYYIWGLSIFINLAQPLFSIMRTTGCHERNQNWALNFSPALIERFGLFNILVLAEIFVGVVSGLNEHEHLTSTMLVTGGLGACIAFAMWWLYFDFISHRKPIDNQKSVAVWLYMHLFVTMSIVSTGAIILRVLEHIDEGLEPGVRWLLVGSVAMFLACLTPLMRVIQVLPGTQNAYNTASWMLLVSAIVIAALGFTSLNTLPLFAVIVVLLLLPVVYAWIFYIKVIDARQRREQVEE